MKKRLSARRAATFLATLGVLVMSSGIALMVAATPANAAPDHEGKVVVCHATSSDQNPYQVFWVDENSTDWEGHLAHATDENQIKSWGSAGTFNGVPHAEGDPKPDFIGEDDPAICDGDVVVEPPVCPEGTDNAGEEIPEGQTEEDFCTDEVVPPVCPEGTDNAGEEIPEGETEESFCDAPTVVVDPPETPTVIVDPPTTKTPTVTTPTVVSAGLTDVAKDMRGEQGLALVFAGMLLLLGAGGLGLRVRGGVTQA
jgi:hypothetical protein